MHPKRTLVFLPCHTLDDFPTWLEEPDADDVLAAWTAAWHPAVVAAVGGVPGWASVDLRPPDEEPILGIVPARYDTRFSAQADHTCTAGSVWVRHESGLDRIVQAALRAVEGDAAGEPPAGQPLAEDFHALGMALLLVELLARRMRSRLDHAEADFAAVVVAAARAAVAGDEAAARDRLREAFAVLEAARARFYPVDAWLLDLVLVADSTLGRPLRSELESPVPLGIVATGKQIDAIAAAHPESLAALREAVASGRAAACGGRDGAVPLDGCLPEEILADFHRGRSAWRTHVGVEPRSFAQYAGGSSGILPQLLSGLDYAGVIWCLFDGTPLPDPGTGRIRWEGTGGGCIDGVARPPLDARSARTILALPGTIGEAMDHDHVVVVTFAHHAGTAGRWHGLLRRIGSWTTALGTFVTPDTLFTRTAGSGTLASFEPDSFPPTLPRGGSSPPLDELVAATTAAAAAAVARRVSLAAALPAPPAFQPSGRPRPAAAPRSGGIVGRLLGGRTADELVLESPAVRLEVHRQTGGILSLRRPCDRGNRLSQQLALRSTRPAPRPGAPWESPDERAEYTRMRADAVERGTTACGREGFVSRGRLVDGEGREVGTFTQGVALVDPLPLAIVDIDVRLARPTDGAALEHYAACRFAWHENEEVEVRRSLHGQSIVTERMAFTAPLFVCLHGDGPRGRDDGADAVSILTGGLPWHVRTSPHMLDCLLVASGGSAATRRLAIGLGLRRPWELALVLAAGGIPELAAGIGPATARITVDDVEVADGRPRRARIGLVESAGQAGDARIEWAAEVVRATVCDARGTPREAGTVTVAGRSTTVSLRRFEWLHLDVEFAT